MAVARLVAAPFPLAASRGVRCPPARMAFAPLPLSSCGALPRRAAVPVLRVAADDRAAEADKEMAPAPARMAVSERAARKESERRTYLVAAVMSSLGITSMAAAAVYYRFAWQMEGGEIPVTEMFGTFALSVGAAVGMEFWARWAHRALWHASLWHMHESHHRPRDGPFELNDVFAIVNAVPAMSLLAFGFFNRGLVPGLCFGAVRRALHSLPYTPFHSNLQFPSSPPHTCGLHLKQKYFFLRCPIARRRHRRPCAHRQTTTRARGAQRPISYRTLTVAFVSTIFYVLKIVMRMSVLTWRALTRSPELTLHVSACDRGSGSRCSGWRTCSSTTAWSTAGSPSGPSRTCPTSVESPPPIRFITWTSSTACRMGCSSAPRSWRRWAGPRSWRRRSRGGSRGERRWTL